MDGTCTRTLIDFYGFGEGSTSTAIISDICMALIRTGQEEWGGESAHG